MTSEIIITAKDRSRFFRKVQADGGGCWPWKGWKNREGYGRFWLGGRDMTAHRVALLMAGVEVQKGKDACHRCDNKSCVRPAHLFVGSRSENILDCFRKGLHNTARGARSWNAKLSDEAVSTIRALYVPHGQWNQNSLAKRFGVSQSCIWSVLKGKAWGHVA